MAAASSNVKIPEHDEDIFNCPICLELLRNPKNLPCLHAFCESCLDAYIRSSSAGKDNVSSFECPVCRQDVKSPDINAAVKEWAGLMSNNNLILKLMERSGTKHNEKERSCGPCERGGETSTSQFWCFECCDSLCETCKKFHERMKSSSHHKVAPIENMEVLPAAIPEVEEPCLEHKGEVFKVYCLDHQKMCCVICLAILHRECKNIKTFDEMAEMVNKDNDVGLVCEKLQGIRNKVEPIKQRKQENLDQLCKKQQDLLDQVSVFVEEAKSKIDKYHEDFKNNLDQIHKSHTMQLSEQKDKLDHFQKNLENNQKMITAVLKHGTQKQLFVTIEKIRDQMGYYIENLQKDFSENKDVDYRVECNADLANFTSVADIQVATNPCKQNMSPVVQAVTSFCNLYQDSEESIMKADISDIELVKLWDVKDTTAWFTGGTFLEDERLVFADFKNNMLKVYDNSGNLLKLHKLSYKPWDVVTNLDNTILVSDFDNGFVYFYDISLNSLNFSRAIRITAATRTLRGFDICDNYIISACDQEIYISNKTGVKVKSIESSKMICYVCSSSKKDKFYYSTGDSVHCLAGEKHMEHEAKYSFPEMKNARGIAVDKDGNIFVCGRSSKALHLLSSDGKTSCILKSSFDCITQPYAIGMDNNSKQMFVTSYKDNCNHEDACVEVYQVQAKQSH